MRRFNVVAAVCIAALVLAFAVCAASPALAAGDQANFSLIQGNFGLYTQTPPGGTALEEIFKNTTIIVAGGQATASTNVSISFMYRDVPCTGTGYLTFGGAFTDAMGLLTGTYSFGYDIVYGGGWMGNMRMVASYTGRVEVGIGPNDVTGMTVIPFAGDWTITDYTPGPSDGWVVFGSGHGTDTVRVTFSINGTVPDRGTTILEGFKGTGKVKISRDGGQTWTDTKPGDQVQVDDLISVENVPGTRARIVYRDGSFFTMRPGALVRTLSGGLQVQQGEVWINLKKQGKSFEVVTPTSVCGVLGTEFQVTVEPGISDEIVLFSGQVTVSGNAGGTAVLAPGQKVTSTAQGLGPVESSTPFTDIAGSPYRSAILGMSQAGIVSGRQQGGVWLFAPLENVKRAQFAKMVCGAVEVPVSESSWLDSTRPFPDLDPDRDGDLYPHDHVAAAASAGIIKGDANGNFNPYANIYRVGVVLMVVRALESLSPTALDPVPAGFVSSVQGLSGEHAEVMKKAEHNGLLGGLTGFGSTWDPWGAASRGEVAQILWNAMWR